MSGAPSSMDGLSPTVEPVPVSPPDGASIPSAAELRELLALHAKASSGEWKISGSSFGFGSSLWISTWWRDLPDSDGPICSVAAERTITQRSKFGADTTFSKRQIKTARDDADLIVSAVNALPKLIAALLGPGQVDETGWLLECPADKYGPVRYLSVGEPPVISAADATRFCRKIDAERYIRAHAVQGVRATEHAWTGIDPASAMSAGTAETPKVAQGDSPPACPEGDAQTHTESQS